MMKWIPAWIAWLRDAFFLALNEILSFTSPYLRMSSGLEAIEGEVFEKKYKKIKLFVE